MTVRIGLREITRHTSQVVHRAAAGESILISEHDELIAMLVPLPRTGDPAVDELIREGRLTPPSNPAGVAALQAILPVPAGDEDDGEDVADALTDLREDRL